MAVYLMGDKVFNTRTYERGIVSGRGYHPPESGMGVFVVYHCGEDWDHYNRYTAALTPLGELINGWPDGYISQSCAGERCFMCGDYATHKVGEEKFNDRPDGISHNFTVYICCEHFGKIFGAAAVQSCTHKISSKINPQK